MRIQRHGRRRIRLSNQHGEGADLAAAASWPRFDLVRIGASADMLAPVARRLAAGVPKGLLGQEYRPLDQAAMLAPGDGGLVAFGTSGGYGRICVEPATGAVVHVPTIRKLTRNPVNASLDLFGECVAAVIRRFPFYCEDSAPEEREQVAEELRAVLAGIDATASAHNGFWETFVDDVAAGDYATEEIVGYDG
jgi:hypothetical protein